jgi:hypothetical protein
MNWLCRRRPRRDNVSITTTGFRAAILAFVALGAGAAVAQPNEPPRGETVLQNAAGPMPGPFGSGHDHPAARRRRAARVRGYSQVGDKPARVRWLGDGARRHSEFEGQRMATIRKTASFAFDSCRSARRLPAHGRLTTGKWQTSASRSRGRKSPRDSTAAWQRSILPRRRQ